MLTRRRHTAPAHAPTNRPAIRIIQTACLTTVALFIAACGGGENPGSPEVGTVIIKVLDQAGNPVRDARVALHAGVNSTDPTTDDKGEVVFKDTLAGEREACAAKQGDVAPARGFVVTPGSVTRLSLTLDRRRQPAGAK